MHSCCTMRWPCWQWCRAPPRSATRAASILVGSIVHFHVHTCCSTRRPCWRLCRAPPRPAAGAVFTLHSAVETLSEQKLTPLKLTHKFAHRKGSVPLVLGSDGMALAYAAHQSSQLCFTFSQPAHGIVNTDIVKVLRHNAASRTLVHKASCAARWQADSWLRW